MLIAFLFVTPIAILGVFWIGSRIDPQTGQWQTGRHSKNEYNNARFPKRSERILGFTAPCSRAFQFVGTRKYHVGKRCPLRAEITERENIRLDIVTERVRDTAAKGRDSAANIRDRAKDNSSMARDSAVK